MSAAGGSAAREAAAIRARAQRGLWRRLLAVLGFGGTDARTEAVAARWDIGAAAEAQTAGMLRQLEARGWHILHDRQLPGYKANYDHILVPPTGDAVVALDTKRWDYQRTTSLHDGRVHCGREDRHQQVANVVKYARRIGPAVGLPERAVFPLLVVHGSRILADGFPAGRLEARVDGWADPVHVLGPRWLVPTLAKGAEQLNPGAARVLAGRVAAVLPPYRG